ncbi:MAG: hypothetical protein V3V20_02585 [Algisphaera sp.]
MIPAALLAYRPFFDPLPVDSTSVWPLALFLPLVILVAVAYKTIKLEHMAHVPGQAARLAVQIVLFIVGSAALLWIAAR